MTRRLGPLALLLACATAMAGTAVPYDEAPIAYSTTTPADAVAKLQRRIDQGGAGLAYDQKHGYLPAVLDALRVPRSSQVLVFSKTSLQRDRIAPGTPRAIYFSDDVYVGWVPNGEVIEVAATDPTLGTVFYTVTQHRSETPRFDRQTHACLHCHDSTSMTGGVPGLMVRSVFPDRNGQPILTAGSFVTDQTSPLGERWGGWYVTGKHGKQRHMGNAIARESTGGATLDREAGANLVDLRALAAAAPDLSPYLGTSSDLVALMVLEHQAQMHNLLTRAAYETKLAMRDDAAINEALGRPLDVPSDTTKRRLAAAAESVVRYMLFAGEAPLAEPVAGTSRFAEEFARRGPRDAKGRSLRDLDLRRRLFKHPCSYLIHGEQMDALPAPLKDRVYRRLWEVVSAQDRTPELAHLTAADRRAIREILVATKPGLPGYFRDVQETRAAAASKNASSATSTAAP